MCLFSYYALNDCVLPPQEPRYVSLLLYDNSVFGYFIPNWLISCSLQQVHLALIAIQKKTLGLPEIVCHLPPKMIFLHHLQLRKATLLPFQKTQMTIQNASSAWSSPKMPQLSTVTQDTAAVAGPVRRCLSTGGIHAQSAGLQLIM